MTEQEARRRKRQSERDRLLGERRLTYTVPETAVILGLASIKPMSGRGRVPFPMSA